MTWIDILVIFILFIIISLLIIYFVRKKIKGHSVLSECDCCSSKNKLVKQYNKKYNKKKCCR